MILIQISSEIRLFYKGVTNNKKIHIFKNRMGFIWKHVLNWKYDD